jgi:site-specific DNA-adenine methylase
MVELPRPFRNYYGNKANNGILQALINVIPPHDGYAELYLGSGGLLANKLPATINLGNDINPLISYSWKQLYSSEKSFRFTCLPALSVLRHLELSPISWLIYLDPPYLKESRRAVTDLYVYEMEKPGHIDLLNYVLNSKLKIIISGYASKLYSEALHNWNLKSVCTSVHGKAAVERLWFNFQVPIALHDYRCLGKNFTDRQRIKRKVQRWKASFDSLPVLEQKLMLEVLTDRFNYDDGFK